MTENSFSLTQDIFLGRQPILDRNNDIVAYELLFRSSHINMANVSNDLLASAQVITHAFTDLGIEGVLGNNLGFINVSADLLTSDMVELLPKEKVVLELLETIEINEDIVSRCIELKKMGFQLALDDFTQLNAQYEPLKGIIDIIKIDLIGLDNTKLEEATKQLKGWPVKLLAEKVDNLEQANHCRNLGYELFQGYYFAKPVILTGKRADPSKLALLRLLGMVLQDAENFQIEQEFKVNPNLTYNLMRLVNSVACGVNRTIHSLNQALVVLGRRQLQRWLQLLLYVMDDAQRKFPSPLMQLAANRGRLMELIAEHINPGDQGYTDRAFMTGILSLIDTLLNMPLGDIIAQLRLPIEVSDALIIRKGELGNILKLIESIEENHGKEINVPGILQGKISVEALLKLQMEAIHWTEAMGRSMA